MRASPSETAQPTTLDRLTVFGGRILVSVAITLIVIVDFPMGCNYALLNAL